jgi:DNA-binding transcriptional ArsR family regulator
MATTGRRLGRSRGWATSRTVTVSHQRSCVRWSGHIWPGLGTPCHASIHSPLVRMDDVFKALADPTRRRILDESGERNGQTLFEICSGLASKHQLGSSRQAISQHLKLLEAADLIETRREGRFKLHCLNTRPAGAHHGSMAHARLTRGQMRTSSSGLWPSSSRSLQCDRPLRERTARGTTSLRLLRSTLGRGGSIVGPTTLERRS